MEENKVANSWHFFKVMLPGFHKKLNLPPSFCRKLKQEKSEWAMLKSRLGTSKIKVCRNCEGVISLEFGWPQFVDQHSLSIGDFVVFEHFGGLKFNVFVFDHSACEKEFPIESKRENKTADQKAVNPSRPKKSNREAVISYDSRNPHFVKTMKPYHEKYSDVTIPLNFVRLNNLGKKKRATLRDGRGRLWAMTLKARKGKGHQFRMRGGWPDFYVSNELKVGDTIPLYFVRSNDLAKKTSATLRDARGRLWGMTARKGKGHQFRMRDFYASNELKVGDVCVFLPQSRFTKIHHYFI